MNNHVTSEEVEPIQVMTIVNVRIQYAWMLDSGELLPAISDKYTTELCQEGKAGIMQSSDLLQKGVDPDVHDEVPYNISYANCTMYVPNIIEALSVRNF